METGRGGGGPREKAKSRVFASSSLARVLIFLPPFFAHFLLSSRVGPAGPIASDPIIGLPQTYITRARGGGSTVGDPRAVG